jgi:hypothetical protein
MFERVLEREVEWGGRTVITQVYSTLISELNKQMKKDSSSTIFRIEIMYSREKMIG